MSLLPALRFRPSRVWAVVLVCTSGCALSHEIEPRDATTPHDATEVSPPDPPPRTGDDGDRDGDGLRDGEERSLGTDPDDVDTDGDGVTDGVELHTDSDPLDPTSNALARGDVVFVVQDDPVSPVYPELGLLRIVVARANDGETFELRWIPREGGASPELSRFETDRLTAGCSPGHVVDLDGDGWTDAFEEARAGAPLCWHVRVEPGEARPTSVLQRMVADIVVLADGVPVEQRVAYVIVPPASG